MPFDSLKSLQNNYATQVLDRAFSRFSCKRDTDIEHFLRNRAVQFEELAKSRTYLFVDDSALENNQIEIAAFPRSPRRFCICRRNYQSGK